MTKTTYDSSDMKSRDRRDTDAVARPIDPGKIVPEVRPWTKEEAEKARQEYKARRALKVKEAERRPS